MRIDHALKQGRLLVINHLGKSLTGHKLFGIEKIIGISTKTALVTSLKSYYEKNNEAGMAFDFECLL